jgi:hypothetical protein
LLDENRSTNPFSTRSNTRTSRRASGLVKFILSGSVGVLVVILYPRDSSVESFGIILNTNLIHKDKGVNDEVDVVLVVHNVGGWRQ